MLSSPHILRNKTKQLRIEKKTIGHLPLFVWKGNDGEAGSGQKVNFKPGSKRSKSGRTNDRNMTDNYNYLVQAEIFMFFAKPVRTH